MNLAYEIEKRRAAKGDYPPDWPLIATRVKALARWCCERCGVRHNEQEPDGTMLTVHHLDGNKWNCEWWNLAALCQRCHLRIQARVDFYRDSLNGEHSRWMARHVAGYNVHALLEDLPPLRLEKITERSYAQEWPKRAGSGRRRGAPPSGARTTSSGAWPSNRGRGSSPRAAGS